MIRIKTMSISGSFGALRQPQDDSAFNSINASTETTFAQIRVTGRAVASA